MKILVTGSNGMLGREVCQVLADRRIPYRGVDLPDLDLTDRAAVSACLSEYRPTAILHCAAYTAVDVAEDEADRCFAVNLRASLHLAQEAKTLGAKLLFLSSDYVFSGKGNAPYLPSDAPAPLSVYGASKAQAEEEIRKTLPSHFIVRTSWMFGLHGKNFVKTMLRLANEKDSISVVNDQIGSPTYARDLAPLLCDMIVTDRFGTYHATNEGFCSWAEFAAEIMRRAGKLTAIRPIPSSQYPTRATRPKNSRLSKDVLTENGFKKLPHWQNALERYLSQLREAKDESLTDTVLRKETP